MTEQNRHKMADLSIPGSLTGILLAILVMFTADMVYGQRIVNFLENNRYGYKDINGKVVITPRYQYPAAFNNGIAVVRDGDEDVLVIDSTGKVLFTGINPEYNGNEYKHVFSGGMIAMYDTVSHRYGFKNLQGNWLIQPKYYEVEDFRDGLAAVWENPDVHADKGDCGTPIQHSHWGYINTADTYIITPEHEEPGKRINSRIVFEIYGKTDVYTLTGQKIKE